MKKPITLAFLLAFSLGLALPVVAQDSVKSEFETRRIELQNKVKENKDKLEENREKLKEVKGANLSERDEVKSRVSGLKLDVAKKRVDVTERVFLANIERLETLTERVESRIDKLSEEGASTTDALAFVALAKTNIADAKAHIATTKTIGVVASSTEPVSSTTPIVDDNKYGLLKAEIKEARIALVEAKQHLMKAVQALKGLGNSKRAASSTPATE